MTIYDHVLTIQERVDTINDYLQKEANRGFALVEGLASRLATPHAKALAGYGATGGALSGYLSAEDGHKLKGAAKGGLLGGAIGYVGGKHLGTNQASNVIAGKMRGMPHPINVKNIRDLKTGFAQMSPSRQRGFAKMLEKGPSKKLSELEHAMQANLPSMTSVPSLSVMGSGAIAGSIAAKKKRSSPLPQYLPQY